MNNIFFFSYDLPYEIKNNLFKIFILKRSKKIYTDYLKIVNSVFFFNKKKIDSDYLLKNKEKIVFFLFNNKLYNNKYINLILLKNFFNKKFCLLAFTKNFNKYKYNYLLNIITIIKINFLKKKCLL